MNEFREVSMGCQITSAPLIAFKNCSVYITNLLLSTKMSLVFDIYKHNTIMLVGFSLTMRPVCYYVILLVLNPQSKLGKIPGLCIRLLISSWSGAIHDKTQQMSTVKMKRLIFQTNARWKIFLQFLYLYKGLALKKPWFQNSSKLPGLIYESFQLAIYSM